MFDDHIDDDDVEDLNITNKDIPYLNDGGNLSRNIGVEHKQKNQRNHFACSVVEEHQPNHHLEGYNNGNDINKEVDEVAEVVEEVHVVRDNESSTNNNFDMNENAMPYDESADGFEYEYAHGMSDLENNLSIDGHTENPVNYTQMPRMLREFESNLD